MATVERSDSEVEFNKSPNQFVKKTALYQIVDVGSQRVLKL